MSSRSLVEIKLPGGGNIAQIWCWSSLTTVDWTEFFAPLAALIPDGEWTATPIPDDVSDRQAMTGH